MQWYVVYQDGEPICAYWSENLANDFCNKMNWRSYNTIFTVKCQTVTIFESGE